jgi:hypothetical protein
MQHILRVQLKPNMPRAAATAKAAIDSLKKQDLDLAVEDNQASHILPCQHAANPALNATSTIKPLSFMEHSKAAAP